jgi:hypothetical protein
MRCNCRWSNTSTVQNALLSKTTKVENGEFVITGVGGVVHGIWVLGISITHPGSNQNEEDGEEPETDDTTASD